EGRHVARRERLRTGAGEGLGDHGIRVGVASAEDGLVRAAAEPHDVAPGERQLRRGVLLDERHDAGAGPAGQCEQVAAVAQHGARATRLDARERAQRGRLAGAVRPDDGREGAPGGVEVHIVHELALAHPHRQAAHLHACARAHARLLRRSSSAANTGAPMSAVTIPTGSSRGSNAARASVSAHTRNTAPARAESGSSARLPGPMSSRTACGSTSPTKPIAPETATSAPVSSAPPPSSAQRAPVTGTPRAAAERSPKAKASSTRPVSMSGTPITSIATPAIVASGHRAP